MLLPLFCKAARHAGPQIGPIIHSRSGSAPILNDQYDAVSLIADISVNPHPASAGVLFGGKHFGLQYLWQRSNLCCFPNVLHYSKFFYRVHKLVLWSFLLKTKTCFRFNIVKAFLNWCGLWMKTAFSVLNSNQCCRLAVNWYITKSLTFILSFRKS